MTQEEFENTGSEAVASTEAASHTSQTDSHGRFRDWAARLQASPVEQGTILAAAQPLPLPVSEDIKEAARLVPDHWLGVVDPTWPDDQPPPPRAIVGQWRSDSRGEVVEWQDNEDYAPSPLALGWDNPTDEVDAAIQLAVTGYAPADRVAVALAGAEVAVLVDATGTPVTASSPDGSPVVPVFSSETHLFRMGALGYQVKLVPDLVSQLPPGHTIYLNPAGPVAFGVDMEALLEAILARRTARTP
ncbi:type VII secretion system-associated protein [Streptomyces sp. NPDC060030]|uniref:type VII secretion system-associated protein n=1 Tax=Streptomyces sp. NPDC060030 TaxID=3347042 RepID=UPI0036A98AEF